MIVNGRKIGDGAPCYIVAEMSANHNQDLNKALKIIHAAKEAGADAIKLQTYTPDTLTMDCDNKYFRLENHPLWGGTTLYELYSRAPLWDPRLLSVSAQHLFRIPRMLFITDTF